MPYLGVPTTYLPHQGVKFLGEGLNEECGNLNASCQIVEQTDPLAFQFLSWETADLLAGGNLDTIADFNSWVTTSSVIFNSTDKLAEVSNGASAAGHLYQTVFSAATAYKLVIDYELKVPTTGQARIVFRQILVAPYTETIILEDILNSIGSKRVTKTIYFISANPNQPIFSVHLTRSGDVANKVKLYSVHLVQIAQASSYTIAALNLAGVVQATLPASAITQTNQNIIVNGLWSEFGLADGCCQLRVTSAFNIFEENFSNGLSSFWQFDKEGTFTFNAALAAMCAVYTGSYLTFAQVLNVFEVGATYTITYDVVNYTDGRVRVKCGTTNGTIRNANGTYTQTLVCNGNTTLRFDFIPDAPGVHLCIDNITIKKGAVGTDTDAMSECFDLATSHDCSKLIQWRNDEDIMNFVYLGNLFKHALRITSKWFGVKYPTERNIGLSSNGVKTMDYAALRKTRILDVHYAREWVHDALAVAFLHDEATIEGKEYIIEDDYEPTEPDNFVNGKFYGLLKGRLEIQETEQNLINRNE